MTEQRDETDEQNAADARLIADMLVRIEPEEGDPDLPDDVPTGDPDDESQ